jgi:hypothetical protein
LNGLFILNGSGGTPGSPYHVLTSTNVSLPLAQWTPLFTNNFDANGDFAWTNAMNVNVPQQFYLIQVP